MACRKRHKEAHDWALRGLSRMRTRDALLFTGITANYVELEVLGNGSESVFV